MLMKNYIFKIGHISNLQFESNFNARLLGKNNESMLRFKTSN